MRTLATLLSALLLLQGCSYFQIHRMEIEQGNVLTEALVSQVHPGMSQGEVKNILGEPVLANIFDPNRLDYVYTLKPGDSKRVEKYITLIFQNDHLVSIQGNLYSPFIR